VSDGQSKVRSRSLNDLRASIDCPVLTDGDAGYDEARSLWNGMIDRKPAVIVRCRRPDDVVQALSFARAHDFEVSVRGGGHSMPGLSVCEGGLMIDLSLMKDVRIDVSRRVAHVEPGVTLGEFDRAAQASGLATPAGTISHTGVAGLSLGGGMGWLMRKHGLTCDNLIGAEVVTADGQLVYASDTANTDLLWGLRGGGGNFGVVTSFEFRLYEVGPSVLSGALFHPMARAGEALRYFRDFVDGSPDELTAIAPFFHCPVDASLPSDLHGQPVLAVFPCWCGSHEEGEAFLAPLRSFGPPIVDQLAPVSFVELQSMQDETFAWGKRYYNKNIFLSDLHDRAIEVMIEHYSRVPSSDSILVVMQYGGQVARVDPFATAFANRQGAFAIDITSIWTQPSEDERHIAWVRSLHAALTEFGGGTYGNTTSEGGPGDVYGENYARLRMLKAKYDPTNVFHLNNNIEPLIRE
jgi:FAD/FMN-containing dehydrogenase